MVQAEVAAGITELFAHGLRGQVESLRSHLAFAYRAGGLEAVTVLRSDARGLCHLLMVTDNDDGVSEILEATLEP